MLASGDQDRGFEPGRSRRICAGFHHVTARLARVLKLMNGLFILIFSFFFSPGVTEIADAESVDTGALQYFNFFVCPS
jgi:hypothetical protein